MRRVVLSLVLFFITPLALASTIYLLVFSYYTSVPKTQTITQSSQTPQSIVPLASAAEFEQFKRDEEVERYLSDPRIEAVKSFFAYYKSPLEPYAMDVVIVADAFNIDYRLIPAIAMQESTLCKRIPHGSNNCWGFGIYGAKKTTFDSYEHGIYIVSKALATRYVGQGLKTPEEIMTKYTPSNTGNWAQNVKDFMARIQQMEPTQKNVSPLADTEQTQPEKELEVTRKSLGYAF